MARPISDEELQLKKRARRRLVGAIVLVTAVAVVLPMVLDSEPSPVNQNVDIQIPSPDAGEFKPKGAPAAQTATPIKGLPEAPKAETPSVSKSESASVVTPPPRAESSKSVTDAGVRSSEAADTQPASSEAPKAAKDDSASSGAYVVQVAALSDTAKARQLQKQMSGAGLKTYTETVATKSGEVTRVRAGPYPTREAAEKARAQLKKAGLDGQIVAK